MDRSQTRQTLLKLVVCAMMTAIVFVGNYLRVTFPVPLGGVESFHLANIFCVLCGTLLGPWWGFLASGLGSGLYDLTNPNYVAEAPITFLTKGMYGLVAGLVLYYVFVRLLKKDKAGYLPHVGSAACAAAAYVVVYLVKNYFYNAMFLYGYTTPVQCWTYMLTKVPSSLVNGVIAVVFAPILGVALMKGLRAAHLDRMLAR